MGSMFRLHSLGWQVVSWTELISTMYDGKEFQSFMAVGVKENRWQLIREGGMYNLHEWPLVTLRTGVKSGVGVISTCPLIIL